MEIGENSELDLFAALTAMQGSQDFRGGKDMEAELGGGNLKPEILPKLAQYELTLLDWVSTEGYRKYVQSPENVGRHSRPSSVLFHAMSTAV